MAKKGNDDLQYRIAEISKALNGIDTAKKFLESEFKSIEQELQRLVNNVNEYFEEVTPKKELQDLLV